MNRIIESPSPMKKESPAAAAAASAGKGLLGALVAAVPRPGGLMASMFARGTLPANGVVTPSKAAVQGAGDTPSRSGSIDSLVAQTPPRGGSGQGIGAAAPASPSSVSASSPSQAAEEMRRLRKNGKQPAEAASPLRQTAGNVDAMQHSPAATGVTGKSLAGAMKAASSSTAPGISKVQAAAPASGPGKAAAKARAVRQPYGFDDDSDWVGPRVIRQVPVGVRGGGSGGIGATGKSPAKPHKIRPPVPQMLPLSPLAPKKPPPRQLEAMELLRQVALPPQNPDDTYEVSDKEDSSDEAAVEAAEQARKRKKIPPWCDGFERLAIEQAAVDPDTIFGSRVPACDLDSIFPDRLYKSRGCMNPRRRRGSSQLWSKDRLQHEEVVAYRQKMRQTRRWSSLMKQKQFLAPKRKPASSAAAAAAPSATVTG